jgi:hypothetical protein
MYLSNARVHGDTDDTRHQCFWMREEPHNARPTDLALDVAT